MYAAFLSVAGQLPGSLVPVDPRDTLVLARTARSRPTRSARGGAPVRGDHAATGGRHTVDNSDPDVLRVAQWVAGELPRQRCLLDAHPTARRARLQRVVRAERQLMTVVDANYILRLDVLVEGEGGEAARAAVHLRRHRPQERRPRQERAAAGQLRARERRAGARARAAAGRDD